MPNALQVAGVQPPRPAKKAPIYQGARWTSGLFTNRGPVRDAASTRVEEKYFGPRGDAFLGGENIEISQQLTLIRRPGNSVWNDNVWEGVNSFNEFRLFNANEEQIKTVIDTTSVLYDATNNGKNSIWNKQTGAGQSFLQSVGNTLYWGDGVSNKKWLNTLQTRIPYVQSPFPSPQNPYNFTPFSLDTFIVDPNGNAQQLIGTILQLNNFYILNNTIVFSLLTSVGGINLPKVYEILEPGLQIYFSATSQVAQALGEAQGITLTIQDITGALLTADVYVGGAGYVVNDVVNLDQLSPPGNMGGQVKVTSVGNATGSGYTTQNTVSTTTSGNGSGAIINIVAYNGQLVSATVSTAGVQYSVGDYVYPTQFGALGGAFKVATLSGTGVATLTLATGCVTGVTITAAGEGYYSAQNVLTTGGTGVGLTLTITDDQSQFSCPVTYNGGPATLVTIASGGSGYSVGNIVTPNQSSQPNASGMQLTVDTVNGDVQSLSLVSGGPTVVAYTTGSCTYTSSSTTGSGAVFSIATVSGGAITGITVTSPGTGYYVGDIFYFNQGSATGASGWVASLTGSAPNGIASITVEKGNNTPYTTATGAPTATSGTGTGLTITISAVTGGAITGWSIDAAGSGYTLGDTIYLNQGSGISAATGAKWTVTGLVGNSVSSLTVGSPGSLYVASKHNLIGGKYSPVYATTTSGAGTGATIAILTTRLVKHNSNIPPPPFYYTGGDLTGAVIVSGGSGYTIGDLIYPVNAQMSGGSAGHFVVSAISNAPGPISSITVTNAGVGYVTGNDLPAIGGSGTGAEFNIVVGNEEYYPLTTATDTPTVFSGGNPISDSRANSAVRWSTVEGQTTIDGSALWINRGAVVDGGLVFNWGMEGGTEAPTAVVNNAVGGWVENTYYNRWQFIVVDVSGSYYVMQVITPGKTGASPPTWVTTPGQNTTSGTAVFQCLKNDGDTTLSWVGQTQYTPGHVLEETAGGTSCIFQLQPYSGIMTQGSNFPVYCWQCNSQSGSDVGAAGEIPSGIGYNNAMAQNGGQTLTSATYQGTMNSLFLTTGTGYISTSSIGGYGNVSSSPSQLFPATNDLSLVMQPSLVIPAAGTYTFQIGHQVAMFWGIGTGKLELTITNISLQGGILTVTCNQNIQNLISSGVNLTFAGLQNAAWLNGVTVTVTGAIANTFTASYTGANYGPAADSGTVSSGSTLTPTVISGPMNWISPGSTPNVYNFSTGTPVSGYPIISANYPSQGTSVVVDTVQVNFPAAGVYPADMYFGAWYHSPGGYSAPTTSPVLPGTNFTFYMVYSPPGSSTLYNIIPEGIACSVDTGDAPTFPSWPATITSIQAITPAYPSVTEISGNFTWWNIGPTTCFAWPTSVEISTNPYIIDPNSNQEVPYEPGVSGSTEPSFDTTLYGVTADLANLVWMNNGPAGNTPSGELTTDQGGWKYVVALVDTLDNTVSNASPPSISTGNFFGASGVFVSGGLPESPDPQADYVAIFRTQDGGAIYYLVPTPASGNGNTAYTLPLAQYLLEGFTDTTPDSGLNFLLEAPVSLQNSIPAKGAVNLAFNFGRLMYSVGNVVYWSTGPDTPIGNGYDANSPNNYAEFPSLVTRIVPLNVGTFIFTVSDIYVISGNGTTGNPFSPIPLLQKIGLLSYNALTVNGSIIYFMTTDQQIVELNVHSGVSQVGFPIADQFLLSPWSPATSYLTWHVNGSNDQCLFVADGSTGWFRMTPTAPPEQGTLTWSLKGNIVGGVGAIQSIETSPGNIQLLLAPPPGEQGPILFRDYATNLDNGESYLANFILGSLVLAHPGQLAGVEFITTECERVPGSLPISLGVSLGEIEGPFEDLIFWGPDPPQLLPSETLYSQRFYLSQTKFPAECRHLRIFGQWEATNSADTLLTLTVFGGFNNEL